MFLAKIAFRPFEVDPEGLDAADDRRTMTKKTQVRRDSRFRTLYLARAGLAPQLPREFADLGQGLSRDRFSEASQASAGIDGDSAAEGGVTIAQHLFGLSFFA